MLTGVAADHTTIYRWVQYYSPKILDALKWQWKPKTGLSWIANKTYIKVKGQWMYLYRSVTKSGHTVDFCLSRTRNTNAAKLFLSKALNPFPIIVSLGL